MFFSWPRSAGNPFMNIARFLTSLAFVVMMVMASSYGGTPVTLQQATATFSQTSGDFSVSRAINGTTEDGLGWAILPDIKAQTAVFETQDDIGYPSGTV